MSAFFLSRSNTGAMFVAHSRTRLQFQPRGAGAVGFHGTADLSSLGSEASHGCVRMSVPDVINLYRRVRVGSPVLVR